ncbi:MULTISPECIES: diacylglycerol/lipid kinase family protein [Actinoalloteichus]|uniref:Sphingosine/diacylglycerol kinase-like enzyme n=1 Tax=Actinoalloteichus fjordicus TaxID=1612552 RepID=A0AAC9LJC6_9PSEU|nr:MULTISPECIES: diacylglycerol kinase family protein [Actinoalloteichus]APU17732.1 sphingosine/diacylglycerol kinase-like enzyme [Actinoalloteichus fjordicus]APU23810.1 sphingosine/diacylglycerol kinase-like enzyme [Actinoalloteichus sp. GBA129-24]
MRRIDRAVLIYNPNSTGSAPELAEGLRADLAERLPALPVTLRPTRHAGHARDLAAEAAGEGRPLIVSVSGDGGYNEVVDGVMRAERTHAVCAVLAAGNANDHHRVLRDRPLIESIVADEVRRIDLLRLTVADRAGAHVQHAHSYIGLGLTPIVAVDLEKGGKGSFREIVTAVRTFTRFRPFTIVRPDGTRHRFDSLVFANIPEMAKYATLSEHGRPDDGLFEVVAIPHTAKWRVLGTALRAAVRGLGPQPGVREYEFTTAAPTPMQIDGEVIRVPEGATVRVEVLPGALTTLV